MPPSTGRRRAPTAERQDRTGRQALRTARPSSTPSRTARRVVTSSSGSSVATPAAPGMPRPGLHPSASRKVRCTPQGSAVFGSRVAAAARRASRLARRRRAFSTRIGMRLLERARSDDGGACRRLHAPGPGRPAGAAAPRGRTTSGTCGRRTIRRPGLRMRAGADAPARTADPGIHDLMSHRFVRLQQARAFRAYSSRYRSLSLLLPEFGRGLSRRVAARRCRRGGNAGGRTDGGGATIESRRREMELTRTVADRAETEAARCVPTDAVIAGFSPAAEPSGRKTFKPRCRVGGGPKATVGEPKIDDAKAVRCEKARAVGRGGRAEVAKGGDPSGRRPARREAPTMARPFDVHLADHVRPDGKASSHAVDQRLIGDRVRDAFGRKRSPTRTARTSRPSTRVSEASSAGRAVAAPGSRGRSMSPSGGRSRRPPRRMFASPRLGGPSATAWGCAGRPWGAVETPGRTGEEGRPPERPTGLLGGEAAVHRDAGAADEGGLVGEAPGDEVGDPVGRSDAADGARRRHHLAGVPLAAGDRRASAFENGHGFLSRPMRDAGRMAARRATIVDLDRRTGGRASAPDARSDRRAGGPELPLSAALRSKGKVPSASATGTRASRGPHLAALANAGRPSRRPGESLSHASGRPRPCRSCAKPGQAEDRAAETSAIVAFEARPANGVGPSGEGPGRCARTDSRPCGRRGGRP